MVVSVRVRSMGDVTSELLLWLLKVLSDLTEVKFCYQKSVVNPIKAPFCLAKPQYSPLLQFTNVFSSETTILEN